VTHARRGIGPSDPTRCCGECGWAWGPGTNKVGKPPTPAKATLGVDGKPGGWTWCPFSINACQARVQQVIHGNAGVWPTRRP